MSKTNIRSSPTKVLHFLKKKKKKATPSPRTQIVDALKCRELNGAELKVFEFVCGGGLAAVETVGEEDLENTALGKYVQLLCMKTLKVSSAFHICC